jgi:hypothetical protein
MPAPWKTRFASSHRKTPLLPSIRASETIEDAGRFRMRVNRSKSRGHKMPDAKEADDAASRFDDKLRKLIKRVDASEGQRRTRPVL